MRNTILIISLAVNFFLIGAISGGKIAGLKVVHPAQIELMGRSHGGPRGFDPRPVLESATPERRSELRRVMMREMRSVRPLMRDLATARESLLGALDAEQFSVDDVTTAMRNVTAAEAATRNAVNDAIVVVLSQMEPGERAAALEALKRPRARDRFLRGEWGARRCGERGESRPNLDENR